MGGMRCNGQQCANGILEVSWCLAQKLGDSCRSFEVEKVLFNSQRILRKVNQLSLLAAVLEWALGKLHMCCVVALCRTAVSSISQQIM